MPQIFLRQFRRQFRRALSTLLTSLLVIGLMNAAWAQSAPRTGPLVQRLPNPRPTNYAPQAPGYQSIPQANQRGLSPANSQYQRLPNVHPTTPGMTAYQPHFQRASAEQPIPSHHQVPNFSVIATPTQNNVVPATNFQALPDANSSLRLAPPTTSQIPMNARPFPARVAQAPPNQGPHPDEDLLQGVPSTGAPPLLPDRQPAAQRPPSTAPNPPSTLPNAAAQPAPQRPPSSPMPGSETGLAPPPAPPATNTLPTPGTPLPQPQPPTAAPSVGNPPSVAPQFVPQLQPTPATIQPPSASAMATPNVAGNAPYEELMPYSDHCGGNAVFDNRAFIPNPTYECMPYDPGAQIGIYEGKSCIPAQGPWVELGRGLYRPGPIPLPPTILTGEKNPIIPHFLVFGDFRTAIAVNDNGGNNDENIVWANRLNLDFDFKITSTERIHAFWGPLDEDGRFTRAEFRNDDIEMIEEFDDDFDTLFFEGDLGYIWGGMTDQYAPFDLPFVAGKFPLLFQNGVWMLDAIEGFAFTIPGQNNRVLDWSNFEVTFFFGYDDIDSPAFRNNDNAADLYGVTTFIEAYGGYLELGYAFLDDRTGQGLSYHNVGVSWTRRYFERVSSSVRLIANAGQDPVAGQQTADGQLILWENALVSSNPNFFVPYFNMFVGYDRPQAVALAAGGVLLNTGINFETDGLTGYPRLDDTANNSWGGAVGVNILGPEFSWQLITEFAMVQTFGDGALRRIDGDQYAFGARFQMPISNAWLVRVDGMYSILEEDDNLSGARCELRWKF